MSRQGMQNIRVALIFRAALGVAGDRGKDRAGVLWALCINLNDHPAMVQHSEVPRSPASLLDVLVIFVALPSPTFLITHLALLCATLN